MADPTEAIGRQRLAEINAEAGTREAMRGADRRRRPGSLVGTRAFPCASGTGLAHHPTMPEREG
jgi:hypothetical protein